MISIKVRGDFKKTTNFLNRAKEFQIRSFLEPYGRKGVDLLASATPKDSGKTANAWTYDIVTSDGSVSIVWSNQNVNKGVNIAVILQYGHGTRNGGYVQGRDYINPAMQPIFDEIAEKAWTEVIRI